MSIIGIDNTTVAVYSSYITSQRANIIKFGVLLTLQLLAIPCFLYVFYQFIRQRQLRQFDHHHVSLLLLLISFLFVTIALPMTQVFMYRSYVYSASDTFCSVWTLIHYSLNIINLLLMGFASIERYWLIFHPWLVRGQRGKVLFHYCPLIFCLIFPPVFYFGVIFLYPCESYYDYTQLLCTWPCYFYNSKITTFDLYFNNYLPLICIPTFCSIIYIRVLIQKRSMKLEMFKWRRDKKMILQLWSMSSLYLAGWMPLQLCGLINLYWNPNFLIQAQVNYIYLFPYFIHLIYPFIILLFLYSDMHIN